LWYFKNILPELKINNVATLIELTNQYNGIIDYFILYGLITILYPNLSNDEKVKQFIDLLEKHNQTGIVILKTHFIYQSLFGISNVAQHLQDHVWDPQEKTKALLVMKIVNSWKQLAPYLNINPTEIEKEIESGMPMYDTIEHFIETIIKKEITYHALEEAMKKSGMSANIAYLKPEWKDLQSEPVDTSEEWKPADGDKQYLNIRNLNSEIRKKIKHGSTSYGERAALFLDTIIEKGVRIDTFKTALDEAGHANGKNYVKPQNDPNKINKLPDLKFQSSPGDITWNPEPAIKTYVIDRLVDQWMYVVAYTGFKILPNENVINLHSMIEGEFKPGNTPRDKASIFVDIIIEMGIPVQTLKKALEKMGLNVIATLIK